MGFLQFWLYFSELRLYVSQLRVYISELWLFNSIANLHHAILKKSQNCEFVLYCEIKSHNYIFFYPVAETGFHSCSYSIEA